MSPDQRPSGRGSLAPQTSRRRAQRCTVGANQSASQPSCATAPRDTGPGPDGRQYEYWRAHGASGLGSPRTMVSAFLRGDVPPAVRPLVFGSTGRALCKKKSEQYAAALEATGTAKRTQLLALQTYRQLSSSVFVSDTKATLPTIQSALQQSRPVSAHERELRAQQNRR